MTRDRKRLIQAVLAILMVASAVRLALIYRGRHAQAERRQRPATTLPSSYYVVPRKLYAYDLKSVQALAKQPVWVKEGYRYTFYPYAGHADFKHPAGLLSPLEKLEISQVVKDRGPSAGDPPQLMAVFRKQDKTYAVPIGQVRNGDYRIFADDMFLLDDPRRLYDWPADTWQAIDAHQAKPGMDEIQAAFALGIGIPQKSDDPAMKTVVYPNRGNQVVITYRNGRAVEVKNGS
jgi:hypothetical protein